MLKKTLTLILVFALWASGFTLLYFAKTACDNIFKGENYDENVKIFFALAIAASATLATAIKTTPILLKIK